MSASIDLTTGPIASRLMRLALPIVGTSFIQMTYQMTDMAWLGRSGSSDVAAVGLAGLFVWFGMSVGLMPRSGGEVGVAQAMGARNEIRARAMAANALAFSVALGILYGLFLAIFAPYLIGFFDLKSAYVAQSASSYLRIVSCASPFVFVNPTLIGIFNGRGDSRTPFRIAAVGLLLNIVLDPLFIFGWGLLPAMGARGAAIATVLAQVVVAIALWVSLWRKTGLRLADVPLLVDRGPLRFIWRVGYPMSLQSCLFAIFSMMIAKLVAGFGEDAIATQSIGVQIESVSYMVAMGLATAISAFIGQNLGAGELERLKLGYGFILRFSFLFGLLISLIFAFYGDGIILLFSSERAIVDLGVIYLRILAVSQAFMCVEIAVSGAYRGLGKPLFPSIIGIVFTGSRVPAALIATQLMGFGVESVWWCVTGSTLIKGVLVVAWFPQVLRGTSARGTLVQ